MGDARMSPGLDFPDSSPVVLLLPRDTSLHLFPGPLSPAPRKAPHPACSLRTPHPLPFLLKPLACLLHCTKPIVRMLFCLRFFLPQEAS